MDDEPELILEDGELSDEEEVYKPLQRPLTINNPIPAAVAHAHVTRNQNKSDIDDSDWSSKSDTDSDDYKAAAAQSKKPKVKLKTKPAKQQPYQHQQQHAKRKKYDIWSSHVQEDVLAETLISCDVSRIDRSRDVESYNHFDLRHKIKSKQGNKRRHDQRNNKKVSSMARKDDTDDEDIKGSKRILSDLITGLDSTDEEIAKDLANKLCEEKDDLMLRIVRIAGKSKAIEIFHETKRIEADGGMLIMNQTRRRTPGGIFIFLLKRDSDITDAQQKEIFNEERKEHNREKKAQQKAKLQAIKKHYIETKQKSQHHEILPSLLKRSDLELEKNQINRDRNESESEEFVNNPPPSPVTDGGKETSNDGMTDDPVRKLCSYGDEFLDLGTTSTDMDLF